MEDRGEVSNHLGLRITRDRKEGSLIVDQIEYVVKSIEKLTLETCQSRELPIISNSRLVKPTETEQEKGLNLNGHGYGSLVGTLLYGAICTRPDISYAVSKLAKFRDCHTKTHWKMLKDVFRYLKGTCTDGLHIRRRKGQEGPMTVTAYCDADWAEDKDDRKSRTGYVIYIDGNLVCWRSRQQQSRAQSTCEAEYYAIFDVIQELKLIRTMLEEMNVDYYEPIVVYNDNKSAIDMTNNPMHTPLTKHIDLRYHENRDQIKGGRVQLRHIGTEEMNADILTKGLPKELFYKFKKRLNLAKSNVDNLALPSWSVEILD
jgi:hypothetical protein